MLVAKTKTNKKEKRKTLCVILHECLTKSKGNGSTSYLVPRAFRIPLNKWEGKIPGDEVGITTDTLGGWGGGDLVSLIARVRNSGVREKKKFLCTCKSHRHCSFYNYLLILTMDRKRLKMIRL